MLKRKLKVNSETSKTSNLTLKSNKSPKPSLNTHALASLQLKSMEMFRQVDKALSTLVWPHILLCFEQLDYTISWCLF